jgi:small subunit ribosomal protein S4e
MYQTRQIASAKLPIPRKGTKYVARARSHIQDSVPVVIAVRDMLKLARTAREVKKMIDEKILKINGKPVKDCRDSICLFNIFEADKLYCLSLLRTGKFVLKELDKNENRICKVIGKTLVREGMIQLNLHDGTNVLTHKRNIVIGDSVYLDQNNKFAGHLPLEKGRQIFITKGKHVGLMGIIESVKDGVAEVKSEGGKTANLNIDVLFVLK